MFQTLPFTSDGSRRVTVRFQVGFRTHIFLTYRNASTGKWLMDVFDEDENRLLAGISLLTGFNLLRAHPTVRARLQQIRVADVQGTGESHRDADGLGNTAEVVQFRDTDITTTVDRIPSQIVTLAQVT